MGRKNSRIVEGRSISFESISAYTAFAFNKITVQEYRKRSAMAKVEPVQLRFNSQGEPKAK